AVAAKVAVEVASTVGLAGGRVRVDVVAAVALPGLVGVAGGGIRVDVTAAVGDTATVAVDRWLLFPLLLLLEPHAARVASSVTYARRCESVRLDHLFELTVKRIAETPISHHGAIALDLRKCDQEPQPACDDLSQKVTTRNPLRAANPVVLRTRLRRGATERSSSPGLQAGWQRSPLSVQRARRLHAALSRGNGPGAGAMGGQCDATQSQ